MEKLYALLLTVSCVLLLAASFAGTSRERITTALFPLGVFFCVLVVTIQAWKAV